MVRIQLQEGEFLIQVGLKSAIPKIAKTLGSLLTALTEQMFVHGLDKCRLLLKWRGTHAKSLIGANSPGRWLCNTKIGKD